jgi:hypothetical protein
MTHEHADRLSYPMAADHRRPSPLTMTSRVWYRAVLGVALVETCQIPIIREYFADAVGIAGRPDGACLFLSTSHARGKAAREDVSAVEAIYFSPAAIAAVPHLIAVCGAEPSAPPDRGCATLLVGKESDWDLLPRESH